MVPMQKRKLHRLMVRLRPISYWYFVVVFAISAFAAASTLRQNNLKALELRDHVLEVDKNNGDIETALKELREYTYSHMNTQLSSATGVYPPIQLRYRYDRLVAEEQKRVQGDNAELYTAAQLDCEKRFPGGFSGSNRLPCIQEYINIHGKPEAQPRTIPEGLYKFDFVSPVWSPDLAGLSLVVAVMALVLLVIRVVAQVWLKHQIDN